MKSELVSNDWVKLNGDLGSRMLRLIWKVTISFTHSDMYTKALMGQASLQIAK